MGHAGVLGRGEGAQEEGIKLGWVYVGGGGRCEDRPRRNRETRMKTGTKRLREREKMKEMKK